MLRSLFVIAIIAYACARSLQGPFYALLFYLWIAYFRPESWLWYDFFTPLNLSLFVGVFAVLTTLLAPNERIRFGLGPLLVLLFLAQSLVSTLASPYFAYAWPYWQDFAKSTIISCLIVTLVKDEKRLRTTLIVIACSLGLEATKQGWAQLILNPGGANLNEHPAIGDNNAMAIAMLMLTAIVVALGRTASGRVERWGLRFAVVGVVYRGIITYSRGGFLAAGAMALHYLASAKRKFASAVAVVIMGGLIMWVAPQDFWDRMGTIRANAQDIDAAEESSRSRIHFWRTAVMMANDHPLTGVGHNAFVAAYPYYDTTSGEFGVARSVHSAWFGVLAELGYPGALLFCLIILKTFHNCRRARRLAKRHVELKNLGFYGNAFESALVAFVVGSAFVIFQYTEMLWHLVALSIALDRIVRERVRVLETAAQPDAAIEVARPAIPWTPGVTPAVAGRALPRL